MLVIYLKNLSTVNICDSRKAFDVSDIISSQCLQVPDFKVGVGWMVMLERDFGYVWLHSRSANLCSLSTYILDAWTCGFAVPPEQLPRSSYFWVCDHVRNVDPTYDNGLEMHISQHSDSVIPASQSNWG